MRSSQGLEKAFFAYIKEGTGTVEFCPFDDPIPSFAQASQTLSVSAFTSNPAQSHGEGCFCCSPQVTPPALSEYAALLMPTKLPLSNIPSGPSGIRLQVFHPPRS